MAESIGERILRLRNSKAWSRPQLGREMGKAAGRREPFSGEAVRRGEKGLDEPGREARKALAKVFERSEAYIEFGPGVHGSSRHKVEQPAAAYDVLTNEERALIAAYRLADPRWRLSLRLLAALSDPADQVDAATDVNYVVARVLGKKPRELRYASDQRVEEAFGKAPHVVAREERQK